MRVRAIDGTGDWQFGKGRNEYKRNREAVAQDILTRVYEFVGDCFFNNLAGVNWVNSLGGKNVDATILEIKTVILNTRFVTGVVEFEPKIDVDRRLLIQFEVNTAYGRISGTIEQPNPTV